ncbi:MAG: glycosyltransferase family 4 protein [Phycisphaerales bacterium]|jgi:glycosyltransferase involved in cell wall biosynthesis|nr:glycosyltransferase family 4 protein [Phycisphaerales bacterium]
MNNPPPLRIVHLVNASDPGGLSRYVYNLCAALHDRGHEVAVAGARGPWHHLFEKAPWPWIDLPAHGGPLQTWRAMRMLRRYLKEHPADLLHSHYRRTNFIGKWARVGNVPLLYTLHLSHMPLPRPRWLFNNFGDHVHVASADAGRWLRDQVHLPESRITLIPHGIDPGRFPQRTEGDKLASRAKLGLADNGRVAAYVGRFDDPKNVDWLLDLASRMPKLKLLLVGEGPYEARLKQRIAAEGLGDRVIMLPTCDPLGIYQAIDALLLPSGREGFSLVCAEAMSAGVPVLRTRTSGTSELIIENVTGRSVNIDHDAFIQSAQDFLADGEMLNQMGQNAAQHIREHYTFNIQVDRTIELYRRLLAPKQ